MESLAEEFGGEVRVVTGEELLKPGDSYPMVSKKKKKRLAEKGGDSCLRRAWLRDNPDSSVSRNLSI